LLAYYALINSENCAGLPRGRERRTPRRQVVGYTQ